MNKKGFGFIVGIIIILVAVYFLANYYNSTGKAIASGEHNIGPSQEEQTCMRACASRGCNNSDMTCMKKNSESCMKECNVQKPEETEEISCMEKCVLVGCSEFDFSCQTNNKEKCEKECNMIKEPEAKSEEEACIRSCVKSKDENLICKPGEGGEKGNEICQRCAKQCEYLYAGPCLMEMELEEKKKACQTCEHCYGSPVMGDSGEGYDCIVEVECKDASSEFGDNPGTGPGVMEKAGETIGNVVEAIGDFFVGLFKGD